MNLPERKGVADLILEILLHRHSRGQAELGRQGVPKQEFGNQNMSAHFPGKKRAIDLIHRPGKLFHRNRGPGPRFLQNQGGLGGEFEGRAGGLRSPGPSRKKTFPTNQASNSRRSQSRAVSAVRVLTMSRSPGNWWLRVSTPLGPARPMNTRPTGFSGVPPVGPAMPVTARP